MRNEPKIRKHFLDLTEEQKERIFERDLASRQGEFRSKRQRRKAAEKAFMPDIFCLIILPLLSTGLMA